jgi:hypothetical protein
MSVYFKKQGYLTVDPALWTAGSSSFSGYGANESTGTENLRLTDTDPFGNQSIVWQTQASGDGGADGGWNSDSISIDNTKLYRFSVWVRRTSSTGGGTFYFGTAGGAECPYALGTSSPMCNPYWNCSNTGGLTQNQWYLVVGHIFPNSYTSTDGHPDTGFWTTSGSKAFGINQCNISGGDLKWGVSSNSTYHRTYHYYCGDSTTRLQFFRPRIDICDGTQPTVTALLNNTFNKLDSTSVSTGGSSFKHQKVVATGGVITYVGEWKIHRFNAAGTFTVTSYAGDSLSVDYTIVGGGGGGGTNIGGGGGGGGVLNGTTVLGPGSYSIGVGAAGAGAPAGTGSHPTAAGTNGGNSTFDGLTAYGGGWGGVSYNTQGLGIHFGNSGGSGGGSTGYNNDNVAPGYYGSGAGVSGQGYRGGYQGNQYYSGGGGGAGAAGADGNNLPNGGSGKFSGLLGRPFYFGGGGGGSGHSAGGGNGGIGGGGGGAILTTTGGGQSVAVGSAGTYGPINSQANVPGGNGATNTGGGGGAGSHYNYTNKGGDGGSGIVIIRYKYK